MAMRVTGMYSGLDTESIISELVSAKSTKVTKLKNEQTKLEWKKTVWQDLNSQIYSLYSKTLSNMRYESNYVKKKTTSSNTGVATVVASSNAVNGTQTLKVNSTAQTGYLTGAQLKSTSAKDKITTDTKLSSINSELVGKSVYITVGDGEEKQIEITSDMTVSNFVSKLKEAGVTANFDEGTQRFFISSSDTGAANNFTLRGDTTSVTDTSGGSLSTIALLGLDAGVSKEDYENLNGISSECTKIDGRDAEIVLNGATFTSNSNSFSINGLTIEVLSTTDADETVTITTSNDTSAIYDMIKDFFSEYNSMINEVCKRYNADSASDYDVLTSEQKESMTDEEIEKWETKIKDSLLRKDTQLGNFMNNVINVMQTGVKMSDGSTMYLSQFGIGTLSYFKAEDNEHYAYHIDGDEDDENTSNEEDKLMAMISSDPEKVTEFFSNLSKNLYSSIDKMMARTEYSSIYKIYNDKQLDNEYDDYDDKIDEAQDALEAYEDKWYDKFTAMEVALSKLQSNQNVVSSLLGS